MLILTNITLLSCLGDFDLSPCFIFQALFGLSFFPNYVFEVRTRYGQIQLISVFCFFDLSKGITDFVFVHAIFYME